MHVLQRLGIRAGAALFAAVVLALLIPVASAHASPLRMSPQPGTRLVQAPTDVWAEFNEPLEPSATEIRVYNGTRVRVDVGPTVVSDRTRATVSLAPNVTVGSYIVEWDALSTVDGHPSKGRWAFAVGDAPVPVAGGVETPPFPWLSAVGKGLAFLGLALIVGRVAVRYWVLPGALNPPDLAGIRLLALIGAILHATGLLAVWAGEAVANQQSLFGYATGTAFGRGILLRLALALGAYGILRFEDRFSPQAVESALRGLAAAILLSHGYYSHTAALAAHRIAGALLDALHLLAVMAWAGGLVHVLLLLRLGPRDANPDPERLVFVSRRFSQLAAAAIVVLTLTGLMMMATVLGPVSWAWWGAVATPYGRFLAYKIFLALLMMGLGLFNHYAFVARYLRREALHTVALFRANVRREAINGILVFAIAAIVTNLSPAGGA